MRDKEHREGLVTVRRGAAADHGLIVSANRAMALETEGVVLDPAASAEGVRRALAGGVGAFYLLAIAGDGEVLGQLMITTEWSDWRAREVWWIQSVYVWPPNRGRGVYRALYGAALDEARAAGAAGLRLYVDRRNARAQAVYRHLGMDGEHYLVFEQMIEEGIG